MAEGARLESVYAGNRIEGSNPSPSAIRLRGCAVALAKAGPMHYVYILKSQATPGHYYVGETTDVERRLQEHDRGKSTHTNKHRPWALNTYIAFADRFTALQFEAYLKSGSGRAFSKKHF